jgi:hypothetical protein
MMPAMRRAPLLVLAAVALTSTLLPGPASGFSVTNHVLLTEASLRQIRACTAKHPNRWPGAEAIDAYGGAITACNIKQDDVERKLRLWHFYGGERDGKARKLEVSGILVRFFRAEFLNVGVGFDEYFAQLEARLAETPTTPEHVYATTGAIVHFIQDVAVPAHAIPIFHPSPVWNGDNFDDFPIQLESSPPDDLATCDRLLGATNDTLAGLLRETVEGTMTAIRTEIPVGGMTGPPPPASPPGKRPKLLPRTWQLFWNDSLDRDGFGRYGCMRDSFGETQLSCERKPFTFKPETYVDFARARQRAAVEATVRALMIAQRRAPKATAGALAAACPVPAKKDHELVVCEEAVAGRAMSRCPGEPAAP